MPFVNRCSDPALGRTKLALTCCNGIVGNTGDATPANCKYLIALKW